MKIFDINNPKHVQILKEELIRARRIIREYNEADIWKRLTIQQREELLSSVDDDMGPDFADEYAETEWLQIPDAVTNRIDLKRLLLAKNDSLNTGIRRIKYGNYTLNACFFPHFFVNTFYKMQEYVEFTDTIVKDKTFL